MGDLVGWLLLVGLAVLAAPVLVIVLFVRTAALGDRIARLEAELAKLRVGAPAAAPVAVPVPERPSPTPPPRPTAAPASTPEPTRTPAPAPRPILPPAPPSRPAFITLAVRLVRHWFTEGNVPVKVGMLVLFAGVAALLKYTSEQGWLVLPVELRLALVALVALAGLGFGWQQRERRRSFALSLQGGAIGVLLLVVFAAFRLVTPPLLPDVGAFGLSIVLVGGCGVLAVRQGAVALAVLAILAGFLAPIWLSTGGGSHVVLFSYYALLDAGIVAIAWFRAWRPLNLLGFVFTFAIGTAWGVLRYQPEHFATTQPFLLLFFALFTAVPILFARLRAAGRRDYVDACLLFGTPLVAFSLQAGLLEGEQRTLAACALGLGVLYATLAWLLRRRPHFHPLVGPYAVLAFGFATLAVPLALSARATASVFALEGACAAWLGLRQQQRWPQFGGAGLQLIAGLLYAWDAPYFSTQPVLHAGCMLALLIALAGLASAAVYQRAVAHRRWAALPYYLWGLGWWLWMGGGEIDAFAGRALEPRAWLLFLVGTGGLAALAHARRPARALAWTVVAALASGIVVAPNFFGQVLEGWNLATWLAYAAVGAGGVMALRGCEGAPLPLAHMAWWASLALALTLGLHRHAIDLGVGWRWAAAGLPWLLLAAATWLRPDWVRLPGGARFAQWRQAQGDVLLWLCAAIALFALGSDGDAGPMPWLPLLNPIELLQVAVLALVGWRMLVFGGRTPAPTRVTLLAVAAFALVTVAVLRCVQRWGHVAGGHAMFDRELVQTALTVTWSVLGVAGWSLGSRRGLRGVWLGGAVLMAVVLAKLVLVDRDYLGNLLGIVSFL